MIFAAAALPSLTFATMWWVVGATVCTVIAIILVAALIGADEPLYRGAIAVAIAYVLILLVYSSAVMLTHHAAWVDYRRDHPQEQR